MKSYTDIEQSKKLAEILPLESADMWYHGHCSPWESEREYEDEPCAFHSMRPNWDKPCWSLAALLDVSPDELEEGYYLTLFKERKEYCCCYEDNNGDSFKHTFADNPIDACYEMILMLKELKKL